MNWIANQRSENRLQRHLRNQWSTARDAALDTIASWRDRSAGGVHGTYGITNKQAASQIKFFEEIRRGYAPKIAA